jgi:hypothetical protein
MNNTSTEKDLKDYAEKCINILNDVKLNLLNSFKDVECLEKQKDCLMKLDIFSQGTEILKDVFKIEK